MAKKDLKQTPARILSDKIGFAHTGTTPGRNDGDDHLARLAGGAVIARATGLSRRQVSQYLSGGQFPPKYFGMMSQVCMNLRVPISFSAFTFEPGTGWLPPRVDDDD